jgi:hypothetical protein
VRQIVALSERYGQVEVARAMADAASHGAFAADYIANLVEQRARFTPEASPLHLTRREDLLDLHLQPPDLSLYQDELPVQPASDIGDPDHDERPDIP